MPEENEVGSSEVSHKIPYKVSEEGSKRTLVMDYSAVLHTPILPESPLVMRDVITKLVEVKNVDRIVLIQRQEYAYDEDQTKMLYEVAELYREFIQRGKITELVADARSPLANELSSKYEELRRILMYLLLTDPIAAYVELKRNQRREEIEMTREGAMAPTANRKKYMEDLKNVIARFENLTLIKVSKAYLAGYDLGNREIYNVALSPTIRPYFIYTKLVTKYPTGGEELDKYSISDSEVTIFKLKDDVRPLYFIRPPEFRLSEDLYDLLGQAREIIAKHKPLKEELTTPQRTREVFYEIERDLLRDLAKQQGIKLSAKEEELLTNILIRYTIGFGMIEVLLEDPNIQDISVNAPVGGSPIFIVHQEYGECRTNITPTQREAESWATKLRLMSGRPLDEANPILDTSLDLPTSRARISAVQEPLSHMGLSFALRRHRSRPWTLPLFMQNGMISALSAGLLSFIADGGRTVLIAGTRGSGKTSLLGALMLEIMRKYRIITVEDTLELGTEYMRELNYNIESLKVRSVITGGQTEVSAAEGIRASLRLGDSCLIIGEVRSTEAKALYEAMRIGALAHLVGGTIHGDSPYSVFDRVVNDLEVPITSFKATDLILVANPVRTASGMNEKKRVVQMTEVRKFWTRDPNEENGFADLMTYDAKKDILNPTPTLIEGESDMLKSIGSRVQEWIGNWPAIWENILLRSKVKQTLVDAANKTKKQELLEAPFVVKSNDEFHRASQEVQEESGSTDPKRVFEKWQTWLKRSI